MNKTLKDAAKKFFNENVHCPETNYADYKRAESYYLEGVNFGYQLKCKETYQSIQEVRYALVDGNLDNEPVPTSEIKEWLDVIEKSLM